MVIGHSLFVIGNWWIGSGDCEVERGESMFNLTINRVRSNLQKESNIEGIASSSRGDA